MNIYTIMINYDDVKDETNRVIYSIDLEHKWWVDTHTIDGTTMRCKSGTAYYQRRSADGELIKFEKVLQPP